jgi:pimeloyl-ACP methyl ester carboxylesterase
MKILDLAHMANAAYERAGSDGVDGASVIARQDAAGSWNAFQAVAYMMDNRVVAAFRGTSGASGDLAADATLGVGANSEYFEQAEQFVQSLGGSNVIVCGHSLGGAITQVVANRMGLEMVTFNAPGVAVFASRNIGMATSFGTAVRAAGMVASAVVRPGQAWRDVKATFNVVRGINICLMFDVVSQIGVHYGRVERIPGTGYNPKTQHSMNTMVKVLESHELGDRKVAF